MTQKEPLTIKIPALKRPTLKALQKERSYIQSIESDNSPTKAVTLTLATVLKDDESYINGQEYEQRLQGTELLGFQHAQWLVKHQEEFPELMALLGKVYIDFPGLVVVDDVGNRHFPYVDRDGRRWCVDWRWLGDGFTRDGRVAVSGKSFDTGSSAPALESSRPLDLTGSKISLTVEGVAYTATLEKE